MNNYENARFKLPSLNVNPAINRSFVTEKMMDELADTINEKDEVQRAIERNTRRIAENTDIIIFEMRQSQLLLYKINEVLNEKGKTLEELLTQIKENKHINAEIYSTLMQHKIDNESNRIITSGELAKLVGRGIEVSASLIEILGDLKII